MNTNAVTVCGYKVPCPLSAALPGEPLGFELATEDEDVLELVATDAGSIAPALLAALGLAEGAVGGEVKAERCE